MAVVDSTSAYLSSYACNTVFYISLVSHRERLPSARTAEDELLDSVVREPECKMIHPMPLLLSSAGCLFAPT